MTRSYYSQAALKESASPTVMTIIAATSLASICSSTLGIFLLRVFELI